MSARFIVDAAHCQRAEDELCAMLQRQEHAFHERWYRGNWFRRVPRILRVIGIALSLLGLTLCLFLRTGDPNPQSSAWAVTIFCAFALFFIFLPRLTRRVQSWSLRMADKRARRNAKRLVRIAWRLVPFEANYDLRGDLLVYTRGKDGEWQIGWNRKLSKFRDHGLVIQGRSVTAIFRRHSSLLPSVVILQDTPDWLGHALHGLGMTPIPVASA